MALIKKNTAYLSRDYYSTFSGTQKFIFTMIFRAHKREIHFIQKLNCYKLFVSWICTQHWLNFAWAFSINKHTMCVCVWRWSVWKFYKKSNTTVMNDVAKGKNSIYQHSKIVFEHTHHGCVLLLLRGFSTVFSNQAVKVNLWKCSGKKKIFKREKLFFLQSSIHFKWILLLPIIC